MRASSLASVTAILLALEALALLVVAGLEVAQFFGEGATSALTGVALIVLTAITAGILLVFAVAVLRDQSWARSGGVVLHVLAVIVAGWALSVEPPSPTMAMLVGVPAIIGLVLLLATARQAGLRERAEADAVASDPQE